MKPVNEMEYDQTSEKLVAILCEKTQNVNPLFFRVLVAYYFSVVAAMMRSKINTRDRGKIPINTYAIALATSGAGKTLACNVMEEQVINLFRDRFQEETLPLMADMNIPKLSLRRSVRKGTVPDEELELTYKEFGQLGPTLFSFDSGTTAAVKQARHKLLMANIGSMNLQMDEVGANITGNMDLLHTFVELYDVGKVKQKLVKNTVENTRYEEIAGNTPANMLLFGTPSRLFNGSKAEEEFYGLLDMGYARRCLFAHAIGHHRAAGRTPKEILDDRNKATTSSFLADLADEMFDLAEMANAHKLLQVSEEVTLDLIDYQTQCEMKAAALPNHEEMKKAELSHRYFKALKLAGAYAFVDKSPDILERHLHSAIKLVEDSGVAFESILTRDRPYAKLAKYLADVGRSVTQADLIEDLPFYKGGANQRAELMQLAIAYGYQNNIVIKNLFVDGIQFLKGETLKATNLQELVVSWGPGIAEGFSNDKAPFDRLHMLTQSEDLHWVNHHVKNGHRSEDDVIPGFNMVVIDVDHAVSLSTAKLLLKDYKALYYTTKRHTEEENRFRIILPTNYELSMDAKDYKEFMNNLFEWLPFDVDTATNQRARKWLSHNGNYEYVEGELLDVLPFIPKTSKNEARKLQLNDQQSMDNLERWVINNSGDGNRNNQLLKFALILVDADFDFDAIRHRVNELNAKMSESIEEAEIMGTILVTVGKAIAKR